MFPDLQPYLPWAAGALPRGEVLLVTHPAAEVDGRFVVHHLLGQFLHGAGSVLLLAFHHGPAHYEIVQRKLGLPLESFPGRFQYLAGLPAGTADPLPPLAWVDVVAERAAGLDPELPLLLIIDDLTTLAGSSPPADVAQFLFRMLAWARGRGANLLVVMGNDVPEDEPLLALLRHLAAVHFDAARLASGYSRDVTGLLHVVHCTGPTLAPTSHSLQYKALDSTVRVALRGSAGH
eukprot:EG_transcript_22598